MKKVVRFDVGGFYYHYPSQAVVVTCHSRGKDNLMAVAWHSSISREPPLYGVSISPRRFSYPLILESGEFAVNFLPVELAETIAGVGAISGREWDKFTTFKLKKEKASRIQAPILEEAYAAYECKVREHYSLGDHEWFVGEVVAVHYQEGAYNEEGVLEVGRFRPALYLGADRFLSLDASTLVHHDRETIRASLKR